MKLRTLGVIDDIAALQSLSIHSFSAVPFFSLQGNFQLQLLVFYFFSGHVVGKVTPQKSGEFGWILCRKGATYACICIHE